MESSQYKVHTRHLSLKSIINDKTSQWTEKYFNCSKKFPVSSLRMHAVS